MPLKNKTPVMYLGLIMAFRMLGLFMILPVFSAQAHHYLGNSAVLVGIALGIYGLTQATLQIPLGMLSDHIGRRPVIILGLTLFAIGSIVAAFSHQMITLIIGRAIQGMGAIGSTTLAWVADLTHEKERSKAMAFIGLSIGLSFGIAMILGPILNIFFGFPGIFWLTTGLACLAIGLVIKIPALPKPIVDGTVEPKLKYFKAVFKNTQLLRLNAGIFCLHMILTALFIAIPILLTHLLHFSQSLQIITYLVVLTLAFIAMIPCLIYGEKKHQIKRVFLFAIATLLCTQALMYFLHYNALNICILLFLFFTAFTLLEATLPSLISKIAPAQHKGTAMGVYSSAQFLGIFSGGLLGGFLFGHYGLDGIFLLCTVISLSWLMMAIPMKNPSQAKNN